MAPEVKNEYAVAHDWSAPEVLELKLEDLQIMVDLERKITSTATYTSTACTSNPSCC